MMFLLGFLAGLATGAGLLAMTLWWTEDPGYSLVANSELKRQERLLEQQRQLAADRYEGWVKALRERQELIENYRRLSDAAQAFVEQRNGIEYHMRQKFAEWFPKSPQYADPDDD